MIEARALAVGVVSVYGQAYHSAELFWRSCGFSVGELGGRLASEQKVSVPEHGLQQIVLDAEQDNHFFVRQIDGVSGMHLRIAEMA
jgi:hypothetical protein